MQRQAQLEDRRYDVANLALLIKVPHPIRMQSALTDRTYNVVLTQDSFQD
jgi:hypothetical protein